MIWLKVIEQAALTAVGDKFVMYVPEYVLRQRFHLEAHLVVDAVGARQAVTVFAAYPVAKQPAAFRQGLIRGRGNFGQTNVAILPGNDVTGARDANGQFVIFPLYLANGQDVEELGMERSA